MYVYVLVSGGDLLREVRIFLEQMSLLNCPRHAKLEILLTLLKDIELKIIVTGEDVLQVCKLKPERVSICLGPHS